MNYVISKKDSGIINKLKAVFILLVVFIHTRAYTGKGYVNMTGGGIDLSTPTWLWNMEYVISAIIAHVAVPGFFIVSSMLLYKKNFKWKENTLKKVRTLLVPYFIVITFWIVLYAAMQAIPFAQPFFSNNTKLISEWGIFQYLDAYLGLTQSPLVYPLWFAQNLFFLNLIAVLLKSIIDKIPLMAFIVLWILLLSGVESPIFCLEINALVYFCMGYYFVKYDVHFEKLSAFKALPVFALYIVSCLTSYGFRDTVAYTIADNANICIGFVACIIFVSKCNSNAVFDCLAKYSFNIFIMHEMFLRIALKATAKFLGTSVLIQLVQYFVIPCVIIGFCIIMSIFMEKKLPRFYKIFTGLRG